MKLKIRIPSNASKSAASLTMKALATAKTRERSSAIGLSNVNMTKSDKPKAKRWVRLRTMSLEHGLAYLNEPRQERKIRDNWVESTSQSAKTRLKMFKNGQIRCVSCGLEGSHWHIERAINDLVMPFSINLYGLVPISVGDINKPDEIKYTWDEVMLTHDHILPRSLGGSNNIANAQCMCEPCNNKKANFVGLSELLRIACHSDPMAIHKLNSPETDTKNLKSTIARARAELR